MHSGYFEGILQLRNPNKELIEYVYEEVEKEEKILITKEKKVKNGFDYYFTSNKYLQGLGKRLKSRFCGEMIVSSKLHTRSRQTGKELHRVNVLFRLVECKIGQIIDYKGDKLRVMSIGKKINCKNIKTGKRKIIDFKEI